MGTSDEDGKDDSEEEDEDEAGSGYEDPLASSKGSSRRTSSTYCPQVL